MMLCPVGWAMENVLGKELQKKKRMKHQDSSVLSAASVQHLWRAPHLTHPPGNICAT